MAHVLNGASCAPAALARMVVLTDTLTTAANDSNNSNSSAQAQPHTHTQREKDFTWTMTAASLSMDATQSLRTRLEADLPKLIDDAEDVSDVLDYTLAMVANGKTLEYMRKELVELSSADAADKICALIQECSSASNGVSTASGTDDGAEAGGKMNGDGEGEAEGDAGGSGRVVSLKVSAGCMETQTCIEWEVLLLLLLTYPSSAVQDSHRDS